MFILCVNCLAIFQHCAPIFFVFFMFFINDLVFFSRFFVEKIVFSLYPPAAVVISLQVHELAVFGRLRMLQFSLAVFAKPGEFGHKSQWMWPDVTRSQDGTSPIHQVAEMVARRLGHVGEH